MNTAQLKRFAQEARRKLNTLIDGKLESVLNSDSGFLREKQHTIKKLQADLEKLGRSPLVEKVAYIWFNRLVALRFMDVNGFQPLGVNILSSAQGTDGNIPQILNDIHANIFPEDLKVDRQYVNEVLNGAINSNNPDNTIYRHVLIAVCNDLHRIFPFLFERIDDYTELLLPDDLTSPFSIVSDIVGGMAVEDCAEVEIIGWLYQFYISEKKDEVFAAAGKVSKEDIPARTQLFTPRWIVEYMVQNTVGKLWLLNNPKSALREHMPYYIESSKGNTKDHMKISSVEDIKLLDQACGSGHILVYGFELLAKIYEEQGYSASDIPAKIIENNLYGLEIDRRAAQLAAFAITMKARQYYRRFFRKPAVPHIICFQDIKFSEEDLSNILRNYKVGNKEAFKYDVETLEEATNLGSLIQPHSDLVSLKSIQKQLEEEEESNDAFKQQIQIKLKNALKQLIPLAEKYHCVVDNPPYMGDGKYNEVLSNFIYLNYKKSKLDLMACFMEVGIASLHPKGFLGMINQHSWMFISSYKELRKALLEDVKIDTLLHLGPRTFPEIGGEVVQNTTFTMVKDLPSSNSIFFRLCDEESSENKKNEFIKLNNEGRYYSIDQIRLELIPNYNICYWFSDQQIINFKLENIDDKFCAQAGIVSGNDNQFLRLWFEICNIKISYNEIDYYHFNGDWVPINKGGEIRKFYGNLEYIINLKDLYSSEKANKSVRRGDSKYYFKEAVTWTYVSGNNFSFRFSKNATFSTASPALFNDDLNNIKYLLAYLNSKVSTVLLPGINPTMNLGSGDLKRLPFVSDDSSYKTCIEIVNHNINLTREEWNSRENSWDFLKNELVRYGEININLAINSYKDYWEQKFHTLHKNEEELNHLFIEIYGLQDELTPDISLEDITILKEEARIVDNQLVFQEKELICQFLSYAIGCVFGRYSLDKEGLILANQGETIVDYLTNVEKDEKTLQFMPDVDNIIPVLEEEWFDDDIVNRVKEFIRTAWGDTSYQDNLHYIEDVMGKDLRKYLTKDFYKDHIKRYKKRPIYWQFSSPKGHFNVLIYMHRYTQDTLNHILNSYLRPFMEKVRNDITRQQDIIVTGSASEQGKAHKRQDKLRDILRDCEAYEHDILYPLAGERISIDLDDGILVNYNKFGHAIAPVAGLNDVKTKNKVKGFDWIDISTIR